MHDLNTAMRLFTQLNLDELPIVDAGDKTHLVGMLRRKEAIACYNERLHEFQRQAHDHA